MADDAPRKRTPQRKMTDADKKTLAEILQREDVKVDGKIHIPTVEKLTGLTYQTIYGFIKKLPYLAAQLAEANPGKLVPTEAEIIDPPEPPSNTVTVSREEFERAQALFRQQKKMTSADWVAHNLTDAEAARMVKLSKTGTIPLFPLTQMINGGLIKLVIGCQEYLEADLEKILKNALPAEKDKDGDLVDDGKVQREWRYSFNAGVKLLNEVQKSMFQNQAILIKAAKDMKAMQGEGKDPKKGVYQLPPTTETGT